MAFLKDTILVATATLGVGSVFMELFDDSSNKTFNKVIPYVGTFLSAGIGYYFLRRSKMIKASENESEDEENTWNKTLAMMNQYDMKEIEGTMYSYNPTGPRKNELPPFFNKDLVDAHPDFNGDYFNENIVLFLDWCAEPRGNGTYGGSLHVSPRISKQKVIKQLQDWGIDTSNHKKWENFGHYEDWGEGKGFTHYDFPLPNTSLCQWSNAYVRDTEYDDDGTAYTTFGQDCIKCNSQRRGSIGGDVSWDKNAETFNAESECSSCSIYSQLDDCTKCGDSICMRCTSSNANNYKIQFGKEIMEFLCPKCVKGRQQMVLGFDNKEVHEGDEGYSFGRRFHKAESFEAETSDYPAKTGERILDSFMDEFNIGFRPNVYYADDRRIATGRGRKFATSGYSEHLGRYYFTNELDGKPIDDWGWMYDRYDEGMFEINDKYKKWLAKTQEKYPQFSKMSWERIIIWGETEGIITTIFFKPKKSKKKAESKKMNPVEKAGITGIASGATMEGLETILAAEHENWGGDPKGVLALALAKARKKAKKPHKSLVIEKLDAEGVLKEKTSLNFTWAQYEDIREEEKDKLFIYNNNTEFINLYSTPFSIRDSRRNKITKFKDHEYIPAIWRNSPNNVNLVGYHDYGGVRYLLVKTPYFETKSKVKRGQGLYKDEVGYIVFQQGEELPLPRYMGIVIAGAENKTLTNEIEINGEDYHVMLVVTGLTRKQATIDTQNYLFNNIISPQLEYTFDETMEKEQSDFQNMIFPISYKRKLGGKTVQMTNYYYSDEVGDTHFLIRIIKDGSKLLFSLTPKMKFINRPILLLWIRSIIADSSNLSKRRINLFNEDKFSWYNLQFKPYLMSSHPLIIQDTVGINSNNYMSPKLGMKSKERIGDSLDSLYRQLFKSQLVKFHSKAIYDDYIPVHLPLQHPLTQKMRDEKLINDYKELANYKNFSTMCDYLNEDGGDTSITIDNEQNMFAGSSSIQFVVWPLELSDTNNEFVKALRLIYNRAVRDGSISTGDLDFEQILLDSDKTHDKRMGFSGTWTPEDYSPKENENEFYKAIDNLFFDPKYDRFKKAETFNAQSAQYGDYTTKEFYNYIPNVVSYEENYEKFKNYSKTKLKNMLSIQPNKYLSSKTHMAKALAISNLTENKSISDDVIVEAYILNFTKQQLCVLNRLKYYHNIPISKQELASSLVHQKREGSFGKKNWRFVNNRKYAESTKQMKQQDNERERVRKNEEYSKSFEAKGGYERKDKYIYHECFECGYKTEPIPLVRAQSRICPKCKGHPEDEDGYDVATMIAYEDIEKTMALRKKERLENLFSKHPDMSEELKNHYKNKFGAESSKPHSVTISRSSNSEKKLMAVFEDSDDKKIKTTHFGQRGASDYTKHGEKERMKRYLERHGGGTTTSTKEDWNDPKTAGSLSRWVLWNKPNLKSSFNDYKSRFGLKGSLNVSKSAEIDRFNAFSINVDSTRPNRMNHKGLMIEGDLYCSCGCRGNLEKHDDYKEYQYDDLFEPFIKHLDKEYIKKTWQGLRFYDIKVRMRKPYKKGLINIYFLIEGRKNTRYVNSIVDSIKRRILTHEMGLYTTSGYYNYEGNSMQFRVIELSKVPIQIIAPYLPEERGKYISTLSFNSESSEKEQAKKILKALNDSGYDSLFVGGAVRDKFLGLEPKDYDIGTSATPSQVANVINNLSGFTYVLGPEGDRAQRALTSLINPEVGEQIEVTTYRKEMYGKDRADIDATPAKTFKEDAARRDLTINSMGETIDGEIIDYFGGKEDLENKKIRTVGNPNERFQEDPLRIIRAIRFATKYNFSIDKETYAAIKKNKDLVKDLSSKRRRDEIGKVLVQPNGYKMLMETGILPALMPEFRNMTDYHHKLDYHPEGNLYNHYIEAFKKFTTIPNRTELGAWALLFHDIAKPQTANWDEEGGYHTFYGHDKQGGLLVLENYNNTKGPFEFSKKELQKIAWTTDNHLGKFWDMKKPTKVAKMRNDDNYPLLVQVVTGDTMGIRRGGDEELASRLIEIDEITDKINEQKLKTGNRPKDFARKVIQELNVKNQEISIALNEIEELVSTGQVSSYDEALRVLKSNRQ